MRRFPAYVLPNVFTPFHEGSCIPRRRVPAVAWHAMTILWGVFLLSGFVAGLTGRAELPPPPGPDFTLPVTAPADGVPVIGSFTDDAGPDETFLLVGSGLTDRVTAWGIHPNSQGGREIQPKVQFCTGQMLAATLPEQAYDGIVLVWVENDRGRSQPVVLNAPQPWWCYPRTASAGQTVRIFGRNLARRPHFGQAYVYLEGPPGKGRWLSVTRMGKYELTVALPTDIAPGEYRLWVHAGCGGQWGWSGSLPLSVGAPDEANPQVVKFTTGPLQVAVNELAKQGGGVLELAAGTYDLPGTLVIPQGVVLRGQGVGQTVLQAPSGPDAPFARLYGPAWNQGPAGVHTQGDTMAYEIQLPRAGEWFVWLRYATDMSPWGQPGVSGRMTLALDDSPGVPLDNLPNTGGFGTFRWSRSAKLAASAGKHRLTWKNVQGGGIHIDAFVFTDDPNWQPAEDQFPENGPHTVVLQGEDVVFFQAKDGSLPGAEKACLWLAGDGAAVEKLTILGSVQTNLGVVIRHPDYPRWVRNCRVENVLVKDCQGKQAENCGVRLFHAEAAVVRGCELWGRAPIFLSGVRQCEASHNRLVSVTLWGGNAEGYILGRNEVIEECVIEDNVCAVPPGMEGGGPTGRRMIWVSTGRGSVSHNWIANNREDRAIFGGVAGTDQNVGEMILFEACQRIAFFGPLAGADQGSVTLPEAVPPTAEEHLGNVRREDLAYDAQKRETPFWPPEVDNDREAVLTQYYVTVLDGAGLGQTRRIVGRQGPRLLLDKPWRTTPAAGSLVVVSTAFYQNHIVNNRTVDGMTGIQLWISCIENVVSANTVARQRKPAVFLYGTCTTFASSMPMTWNRGIGPLYFNHVEGTRADETSCGIFLVSGETGQMPHTFPRCLGNVLRHNGVERNRSDGVFLGGNRAEKAPATYPIVMGTIAEFNRVRDAQRGFRVTSGVDGTVLRRNHVYFWYPVANTTEPPVAFQLDDPATVVSLELNSVEGSSGVTSSEIVPLQRGNEKLKLE